MSDSQKPIDEISGTQTTGHEWDGIKELNTPLPRWWLWLFYATVVFSVIYMILFPSIPLINQATPGLLGYSSRGNLHERMSQVAADRESTNEQLAAMNFQEIVDDPTMFDFAMRGGEAAYKLHCVQCHGSGAQGSQEYGYPNLNDDAWLWGGTHEDILYTITHGVRNADDPQARSSMMPAYGVQGLLTRDEIGDTAEYVLSLSGREHDAARAENGAEIYAANCAACHGADGKGQEILGAPNLVDALWLYGGSREAIVAQIYEPQHGVMPPWGERLDEATRKKLAVYVHARGGGQ